MAAHKCPVCGDTLIRKINIEKRVKFETEGSTRILFLKGLTNEYCNTCKETYYNKKDLEIYGKALEKAMQENQVKE